MITPPGCLLGVFLPKKFCQPGISNSGIFLLAPPTSIFSNIWQTPAKDCGESLRGEKNFGV